MFKFVSQKLKYRIGIFIILGLLIPLVSLAVDTAATSPGTVVNDATAGTTEWLNPDNAKVSDNTYADASSTAQVRVWTHRLKATNFGFSIPDGATIDGILVEIEKKRANVSLITDEYVNIVKSDGTLGATNKADTVTNWGTSDAYASYGSSADLWGEVWVYSDINDVDFGVILRADMPGAEVQKDALVDHFRITISYTEAANGGVGRSRAGNRFVGTGISR